MERYKGKVIAVSGDTFHLGLPNGKELWVRSVPGTELDVKESDEVEVDGEWPAELNPPPGMKLFSARKIRKI